MTQPYALFIADILEDAGKPADIAEKAAAELRRLHAQRDALLEVVKKYIAWSDAEHDHKGTTFWERVEMCREVDELASAAIKAAEGEKA